MSGNYTIATSDPRDLVLEVNRIFRLIEDRLDKLDGLRGEPRFWNRVLAEDDVVVMSELRGLVIKDTADPPQYWRIRVTTAGAFTATKLGPSFR